MLERASATHTLGLERAGSHLRGVVLHYRRRQVICEGTFILDGNNDSETVPTLYMTEEGRALERQTQRALVVTAMDGSQTVVRQLEVKLKRESDIDAVLPFQAEPLLPFPAEEAQIDRVIVESNDVTLLTLLAVRRDHLQTHLEEWRTLGVEPEVVGAVPQALAAWAENFSEPDDLPYLVLHVGFTATNCALIRHGRLLAAQSYRGGVQDLLSAYRRDRGIENEQYDAQELATLDFSHIDATLLPTLAQKFTQLTRDAVRTAFGLAKYAHVGDVEAIMLTGEGSLYPTLCNALAAAVGKPLHEVAASPQLGIDTSTLAQLAVPMGLALTALPKKDNQINFRQGTLAYPHPWKRLRVPLALAMGLCAALAAATYLFGQSYLSWREHTLQTSYVELVADLKRDYNDVEKQVTGTAGNEEESGKIIAPANLTPAAIDRRLALFERENAASPDTIALFPNVPRASDVLAWLGNHPQVKMQGGGDAADEAPIQLESFNYRMVKRPELNKLRERYQVQVELEFSSRSPRAARLFYDSLIAPNAMIDPKGEVKWTAANGKYRVAFFLKDRTIYPNP